LSDLLPCLALALGLLASPPAPSPPAPSAPAPSPPSSSALKRAAEAGGRAWVRVEATASGPGVLVGADGQVLTVGYLLTGDSALVKVAGAQRPARLLQRLPTLGLVLLGVEGEGPFEPPAARLEPPSAGEWVVSVGEAGSAPALGRVTAAQRTVVRGVAAPGPREPGARWQGTAPRHRHRAAPERDPGGGAPGGADGAAGRRRRPVNRRQLLTQVLTLWAVAFGAILAAFLLYPPAAKLISVAAFLYLPLWSMRRSGEDPADVGLTLSNWRADVLWAAGLFGVIAVGYFFAFQGWMAWGPAHGPGGPPPGLAFHPRFPRFWEHAIDQPFVVALPEEFFFRGWMQTRLKRVFPRGKQVFGVTVGPALLLTAALFA
jgi:membrane protease YdiL (CAAX protease family)